MAGRTKGWKGPQKHPKDAKVHNGNVGDGKKTGTASLWLFIFGTRNQPQDTVLATQVACATEPWLVLSKQCIACEWSHCWISGQGYTYMIEALISTRRERQADRQYFKFNYYQVITEDKRNGSFSERAARLNMVMTECLQQISMYVLKPTKIHSYWKYYSFISSRKLYHTDLLILCH